MHKLLEVPRRNFARARLTISLARSSPTKGVIRVVILSNKSQTEPGDIGPRTSHVVTARRSAVPPVASIVPELWKILVLAYELQEFTQSRPYIRLIIEQYTYGLGTQRQLKAH